ncbi:MAG: c-type cytochrome [Neisseriaceae bacterium]|nr:c-type cytochrome [Neisseriaceae bacterium]
MNLKTASTCFTLLFTATALLAAPTQAQPPTNAALAPITAPPPPETANQCMACHGPGGSSQYTDWPTIAGQKERYLEAQLDAFKDGLRKNDMMQAIVANLSHEELKTLAHYFSGITPAHH